MPADATPDLLPAETDEAPAARRGTPQQQPDRPADIPATVPEKAPRRSHRRSIRWAMFALLPLALIGGAYWYVTGGQVMSTDDAYVNAGMVGISTDVSGIVQQIDATENQHVDKGQVLVSPGSPSVPDRPRKCEGHPRRDGADDHVDEAGLWAHVERCRCATGAGRARSGDLRPQRIAREYRRRVQIQLRPGAFHA